MKKASEIGRPCGIGHSCPAGMRTYTGAPARVNPPTTGCAAEMALDGCLNCHRLLLASAVTSSCCQQPSRRATATFPAPARYGRPYSSRATLDLDSPGDGPLVADVYRRRIGGASQSPSQDDGDHDDRDQGKDAHFAGEVRGGRWIRCDRGLI